MARHKDNPMDRLTRDALAADAAGMTYGKWKARQYERQRVQAGGGVRADMGEMEGKKIDEG